MCPEISTQPFVFFVSSEKLLPLMGIEPATSCSVAQMVLKRNCGGSKTRGLWGDVLINNTLGTASWVPLRAAPRVRQFSHRIGILLYAQWTRRWVCLIVTLLLADCLNHWNYTKQLANRKCIPITCYDKKEKMKGDHFGWCVLCDEFWLCIKFGVLPNLPPITFLATLSSHPVSPRFQTDNINGWRPV